MGYFEHVLPLKVGQVEPIDIGFPIGSPGELTKRSNVQGLYWTQQPNSPKAESTCVMKVVETATSVRALRL
jgi:hypothetical protein